MTIEPGTLCRIARCPDVPHMVGLMCVTKGVPELGNMLMPSGVIEFVLGVEITAPWLPVEKAPWAIPVPMLEPVVGTQARAQINAEAGAVPMLPRPMPPTRTGWPWTPLGGDDGTTGVYAWRWPV